MNILQKIFGEKTANAIRKGVNMPFNSSALQRFGGQNYGPALRNRDFLAEYRNWVFACVQARAEELGNMQLKLFKGGEEIFEHPVLDLLNAVNDYTTKYQLFEATQAYKDLQGNAFWYLSRNSKDGITGDIVEIYLLKPDKVRIVIDKQNPLKVQGYLFTQPDGQVIPFAPEQILHHRNFDPRAPQPFPHLGMGIVEAAAFAIDTDNEARNWNLQFFRNGARPDGILLTDGEGASDADSFKRLKEEWNEEHQGSDNAFKISVLSGGLKYQELTRNQKDMDFVNQRTFSRDEILALFRTPKSIIGITDDVNRANADASVYIFALRTIKPLMQKFVDTLNEFLLPDFGDDTLRLDFVSPVPLDRAALTEEYTAAYNVWLSRNDIRRMEGLPPTENGEDMYINGSMVVVDKTTEPETVKSVPKAELKKKEKKNKKEVKSIGQKAVDDFVSKMPLSKYMQNIERKGLSKDAKSAHIDAWIKRTDNNSAALKRKLRNYFAVQEKEVQKNLKSEMKGLDAKEYQYKAIEDILFDFEKSVSSGISLITPFIQQYIKESGEIGNTAANGTGFDMATQKIKDFIPKRAEYFATTINDTTRESLLASIQEGIDSQESLDDISKRVADVYGKAQDFRTDMIARTEVAASSNFGSIQGYLQAGVTQHQWAVVNPEDDDCIENDGVIVDIGDSFPSGDDDPPVHPNCMCTTLPIFADGSEDDSGDDGE